MFIQHPEIDAANLASVAWNRRPDFSVQDLAADFTTQEPGGG
jgi:hypothetical protein